MNGETPHPKRDSDAPIARFAELSPAELASRMTAGDRPLLLDVRNLDEWHIWHLPDALLIPLSELPDRLGELDRDQEIVIYCRTGVRSVWAANFLLDRGYLKPVNLTGGVHLWSDQVDSSVPKY